MREAAYWSLVEPYWESVDIYQGATAFLRTFAIVPRPSGLLLAAHWCQSEVRNGGFHQFFTNSTGVLAPEALDAFLEMKRPDLAELVLSSMRFFGEAYPRERHVRAEALASRSGSARKDWDPFYKTDDLFYERLKDLAFEESADLYARAASAGAN